MFVLRLSELQQKDIVDLEGRKVGNIIDVKLDSEGKLLSFVVEVNKGGFLKFGSRKDEEYEITWDKIAKIGSDVILVRTHG